MAVLPPIGAGKVFSERFSSIPDVTIDSDTLVAGLCQFEQFGAMISEIESVRSRFENERSNSAQLGRHMALLAQQMDGLARQQSTILGQHIGRMNSMLQILKSSKHSLTENLRRAVSKGGQSVASHNHREWSLREKAREKVAREQIEETTRRGGEERKREDESVQSLQNAALPSLDPSGMIPKPARTVTAAKRRLSFDLGASLRGAAAPARPASGTKRRSSSADILMMPAVDSATIDERPAKRARVSSGDDSSQISHASAQQTGMPPLSAAPLADSSANNNNMAPPSLSPFPCSSSSTPSSSSSADDEAPASADNDNESESLPAAVQDALKAQAMQMLQAQMSMDQLSFDDLPGAAGFAAAGGGVVKSEPRDTTMPLLGGMPQMSMNWGGEVSVVKPEQRASRPSKKRKRKAATPAVEDTTITDPESVPLKGQAIYKWMMNEPERMYTANDIAKAGIRFRSTVSIPAKGIQRGKVYILGDREPVSRCLRDKNNKTMFAACGKDGPYTLYKAKKK